VSDLLALVTSRPFVIVLAVVGAVMAMVGSAMTREGSGFARVTARCVLLTGYGLTGLSVLVFIAAGFLSGE